MFKKFRANENGNVAIMTAFLAMPLVVGIAGVIDTTRHTRMQSVMQNSADAAVLAAFRSSKPGWGKRQKNAHRHFRANLGTTKFPGGVRMKLTRTLKRDRLVFTYKAATRLDSLFGALSPFSGDQLTVRSSAEQKIGSAGHARLVPESRGEVEVDNAF